MRTGLLGSLLAVLALAWSLASVQAVTPITAILGSNVACDPANAGCVAIPLTPTILCTVTCPFRVSPSYASGSEFWAALGTGIGACVRSTDGGLTWPACTSQPFTTGANELYAGASDGSIVAISTTTGPTTCTISRSVNNATSWSIVFTDANSCNPGGLEGQYLRCLSDGRCESQVNTGGIARVYRSSNNGQSWIQGTTGTGGNCSIAGSAWDGSAGILPSELTGCGGGGIAKTWVASADVWSDSVVWNGTQGDCWGSVVYNGTGMAICQAAGATPDGRYAMRTSTGALTASLTLPNALITSIDAGGQAIAPFANTLYIMATTNASTAGLWVSRDNLGTFVSLGTFSGNIRGGHMFYSGGCIYSVFSSPSKFLKVC